MINIHFGEKRAIFWVDLTSWKS